MATTLEEYQITIAANAEAASRGINAFKESLTSFSRALQTCMAPIREFAGAVQDIASASYRMDFGRLANQAERFARSMRKVASASKERGNREPEAAPIDYTRQFAMETTPQEILEMRSGGVAQRLATELGRDNLNEGRVASLVEQYQKLQSKLADVKAQAESTGKSLGQTVGEAAQNGIGKVEKLFSRISRIFSTLLIRTALKDFMKEFSSVWDAMEKYSKDHGGEFAQTMSMIRGSISQAAVSLATALAPAMRFVAAAANVATNAIKVLANAVNWLLGLLGLSTEFLGMSTEALDGYSNASNSASGSNKDLLASFDELNVIQSSNSGGSNNSSGLDFSGFNEELSAELAAIEMIIAESMLALGIIFTFTGHPGIGIPMMVLGAAAIVAETTINWGKLPEEVKSVCIKIMAIAGTSMLAIGAIIAASGANLPLGIGLMVAGAANLAGAIALSWGDLSDKVKDEIGAILVYCGTALLAIGAILALSGANIPLGIGLMVAGGVAIASAVALNWEGLKESVVGTFNKIKDGIVKAWTIVKEAVGLAWDAVKKWAKAKWSDFQTGWNKIKTNISNVWGNIGDAVKFAWEIVKTWIASKWSDFQSGWNKIKEGFGEIWNKVGAFVSNAWENVKIWLASKWTDFQTTWNNIKEGLRNVWIGVTSAVSNAWVQVKNWLNSKWTDFKTAWHNIRDGLNTAWNNVNSAVANAWVQVKNWIGAKWTDFKTTWENIKKSFSTLWEGIKGFVTDAYTAVTAWLSTTWENNFKKPWENTKNNMKILWNNIGSFVSGAYGDVKTWLGTKWSDFKTKWENISSNFDTLWSDISGYVSGAYDSVTAWLSTTWKKNFEPIWSKVSGGFDTLWSGISGFATDAWDTISQWWSNGTDGAYEKIKGAWENVTGWFKTNVTDPIAEAFKGAINSVIDFINLCIDGINKIGNFTIPGYKLYIPWPFDKTVQLWEDIPVSLWTVKHVEHLASGGFVDKGQLFVANEAGPEMVGQMGSQTAVANQTQIVEGIRKGVHDANEDQNAILRQLCEIAIGILQKDNGFNGQGNIAFGRFAKRSIQLYNDSMGGK